VFRLRRPVLILIIFLLGRVAAFAQSERFERELESFEAADRVAPPTQGEVVFVGSSSIARWDVAKSFPDVKGINRGISGSELADTVRLLDRLVVPYAPRVVVVYAGDNDIADGRTSEDVAAEFEHLVTKVHTKLPQTRIVFIGLKPSINRWTLVDRMRSANLMIRGYCEHDDRVAFIDVDGAMLGWDEKPRHELFVSDGLHMSAEGYQVWSFLLRPYLKGVRQEATSTRSNAPQ
jgi:lysophospholipase L1-like esterase